MAGAKLITFFYSDKFLHDIFPTFSRPAKAGMDSSYIVPLVSASRKVCYKNTVQSQNTTNEIRKVEDDPQQKVKPEPVSSSASATLDTGGVVRKWIDKNIKYPKDAQESGVQGRVSVKFHLDTDGTISNVQIVRGVCPSIDKEAIRVVSSIPKNLIVKH